MTVDHLKQNQQEQEQQEQEELPNTSFDDPYLEEASMTIIDALKHYDPVEHIDVFDLVRGYIAHPTNSQHRFNILKIVIVETSEVLQFLDENGERRRRALFEVTRYLYDSIPQDDDPQSDADIDDRCLLELFFLAVSIRHHDLLDMMWNGNQNKILELHSGLNVVYVMEAANSVDRLDIIEQTIRTVSDHGVLQSVHDYINSGDEYGLNSFSEVQEQVRQMIQERMEELSP